MNTAPEANRIYSATRSYHEEEAHRAKYGIREATQAEIESMPQRVRECYNDSGLIPAGVRFEYMQIEGRSIRPVYLNNGKVDFGNEGSNEAMLKPFPLFLKQV